MKSEQRKYERFDVPLSVELRETRDNAPVWAGTTLNFSRSGLCLKTDAGAEDLDGAVNLHVRMPGRQETIPAVGDIIWADLEEGHSLLGIKIVAMDRDSKLSILDYCEASGKGGNGDSFH